MTWLLLIFFSGLCVGPVVAASVEGASIKGLVELVGSRDASVRKRRDYSGVVVWLEPAGPAAKGISQRPQGRTVKMIQKHKKFVPHILAIPVGATVDFPNLDPIFHNAFSNFSGQPFDVGLYAPGTSQKVRFTREGVVRVFCNIHPTMSAVIVVLRTPLFAVTRQSGEFEIDGVPRGEYQLHIFHERAPEQTLRSLSRKIIVDRPSIALPPMAVSESGYLEVPHKNKYGKDYPPAVEDHVVYPGVRK